MDGLPEQVAGGGIEGVVEGVGIAGADPVFEFGIDGIEVAFGVHGLEVVGAGIELSPDGDHEVGVEGVDVLDPLVGIGEACGVEVVGAPVVLAPVQPVLHDVVEGDVARRGIL